VGGALSLRPLCRLAVRTGWPVGLALAAVLAAAGAAAQRIERYPQQFGPFTLGPAPGQRVTVTGVYQRLLDAREFWRATTLEYWSIQNESRAILARGRESTKTQPPGEYVEARGLTAYLLEGHSRPMLLLVFGLLPSPPGSGVVYRVYGFDKDGAFREALTLEPRGDGVLNPIDSRRGTIALTDGRYLDVSEWMGAFALRVRYAYDDATHRFLVHTACSPPINPRVDREVMRAALGRADAARLEMYDGPTATAAHRSVGLSEKSRVTLLEGCSARFGPAKSPDVWVKVEVDGATGWVSEADFPKLGLDEGG
jgi:hypothetical protein